MDDTLRILLTHGLLAARYEIRELQERLQQSENDVERLQELREIEAESLRQANEFLEKFHEQNQVLQEENESLSGDLKKTLEMAERSLALEKKGREKLDQLVKEHKAIILHFAGLYQKYTARNRQSSSTTIARDAEIWNLRNEDQTKWSLKKLARKFRVSSRAIEKALKRHEVRLEKKEEKGVFEKFLREHCVGFKSYLIVKKLDNSSEPPDVVDLTMCGPDL